MVNNLDDLMANVKSGHTNTIVIAAPEDSYILEMIQAAQKLGLADFIMIGDKEQIVNIAKSHDAALECEIIHEPDHGLAAQKAVKLIKENKASAIMKGLLHTSTFFKAVLNKDTGLNRGRLITQISVFDKHDGTGLQLLTDCAMIINPNLEHKKQIIENAVELALLLGYARPKVAVLSALEVVNPEISDTLDAAILSKMSERGQIRNAIVDGPFALDNAISLEAARHKGLSGEVAGCADILLAPNLQVANVLTKALTYYARKRVAAAVMGADVPIISTSRTAPIEDKILSIALANYISGQRKQ